MENKIVVLDPPANKQEKKARDEAFQKTVDRQTNILDFETLTEKIARSRTCYQNKEPEVLREAFPDKPWLWVVDLYYPNAEGGPLFVDYPHSPYNVKESMQKAVVLKKHNIRFLFLQPDDTIETAYIQLEGKL
jgi:hypothetical protein